MDKIKVETVVDIFCDNLNIVNNRYRNIIKELMINIISKYEVCYTSQIEDNQQYIMKSSNNRYTVEDFFLNRLLFNVTTFEINDTGGRGEYFDYQRRISLNKNKLATLLDKFPSISFTDEQKYLAAKKVVMHEFEHALQTKFEHGPYINDLVHYKSLYKLLNSNLNIQLNQIYDGRNLLEYIGNGRRIQCGLMCPSNNDKYKQYTGTFYLPSSSQYYTSENNINEIFNESEALTMSNSNENISITFPSSNRINIRNIESSNYLITNYGFMLKILIGERDTFEGMYLERDKIIDYFNNNFGEIFKEIFEKHLKKKYPNINILDSWSILNMTIGEAKYSYENGAKEYSEMCHLKLNLAFSLCFEKVIKEKIKSGESLDSCKKLWMEFVSFTLYNNDTQKHILLPHVQVLNDLREYIKNNSIPNSSYETIENLHRVK